MASLAGGIQVAALIGALAANDNRAARGADVAASTADASASSLLAGYSFEEDDIATGPDTFAVFRGGRGQVRLASDFRVSGCRSVEIRDAAGDRDFPELQGYFPLRRDGRLHAHFAFLTTDVTQTLNIALAGPERFKLKKDGIAFWLSVNDGVLRHMSDSIPKRLGPVRAFVWYSVDLDYDIVAGRYGLRIQEEGAGEPFVSLEAQPNAARQPGSGVDVFSFVGDVEDDASDVTYYVDDVMISSSRPAVLGPFVAPGRRKLFVDLFQQYRRLEAERLQCLPVLGPEDVGLSTEDVRALAQDGRLDTLQRAFATGTVDRATLARTRADLATHLTAAADWGAGCAALAQQRNTEALAAFERAAAASPRARVYALSSGLALIALRRFDDADARLHQALNAFGDDPRPQVAFGLLGLARGDVPRAVAWLHPATAPRPGSSPAVSQTAADTLYFALLAGGDYATARDWADQRAREAGARAPEAAAWLERRGDAAYYAGDREAAQAAYESALRLEPHASLWLKLSDLAFLRGDLETERRLRERFYGHLDSTR